MMDLQEATKTLDAYSTLIESQARFCDRALSDETPEGKAAVKKLIALLKVETRETTVILTLVMEEIIKHPAQFVVNFTDELTLLIEAINRNQAATAEARKLAPSHEVKLGPNELKESPSAKAVREFRENRGTAWSRPPPGTGTD
jgi:hypothetical protein